MNPSSPRLRVALGEYDTGWHDPERSLTRAREFGRLARAAGADALVLPEMCASGFTMDADHFAEPEDGASARALSVMAAEHRLWLVAGLSMRRDGRCLNSALVFAPTGALAATYDKQRLFGFAGESEVYSGGSGPCVVQLGGVAVGLFVCFDLRFPELFREVGPHVDACIVVANWPASRQRHWDVLTQARAIENQWYVVAVNRIGTGDGLAYDGGSCILDPWGERCDERAGPSPLRVGDLARATVDQVRQAFPFVQDRRGSAAGRTAFARKQIAP